jgi:hypothetical protein
MQTVNTAVQRAKILGGNSYCLYTMDIQEPEDSLELELGLYKAMELKQLSCIINQSFA